MTLTTDKGQTYEVDWAWSDAKRGEMRASVLRDMPIAEALSAFDGCRHMHTSDPGEGERDHDGYIRLVAVQRFVQDGTTQLMWDRGDTDD